MKPKSSSETNADQTRPGFRRLRKRVKQLWPVWKSVPFERLTRPYVHGEEETSVVQGAAFRSRDHHFVRSLVSSVCAQPPRLEELMAERNLQVHHVTIWRWVQRYAPELSKRCRRELRMTNRSWRVDETYLRIAGKWTYLYRFI
jgi:hypothetical protein